MKEVRNGLRILTAVTGKKYRQVKLQRLQKSTNMGILVVDTTSQLFL